MALAQIIVVLLVLLPEQRKQCPQESWYWSEFENVFRELYCPDLTLQQHAVNRIAVWKCRLTHRISAAVECTSELVSASVLDEGQTANAKVKCELQVRMTYAMALIRFVNLLTENLQKGRFAASIHNLATDLGIPRWIVNLRHEATHNELPSLNMLRTGANFALEWLRSEYWEKQFDDNISRPETREVDTQNEEAVCNVVIKEYMNHKFKELGSKQSCSSDIRSIMQKLDGFSAGNRKTLVSLLVQPGHMTTSSSQMTALNIDRTMLLEPSADLSLPQVLIRFWKPLLGYLHHHNMTPDLISAFLGALSGTGDLSDRIVIGWIFTIVDKLQNIGKSRADEIILYRNSCVLNYGAICENLLKKPMEYTLKLVPSILDHVESQFTEEEITHIVRLTEIRIGNQQNIECHLVSEDIYDKQCLQKVNNDVNGELNEPGSACSGPWKLCQDDVDWSKIPFGVCPNIDLTYKSLELPFPEENEQLEGHSMVGIGNKERETCTSHRNEYEMDVEDDCQENMGSVNHYTQPDRQWNENELEKIVNSIQIFS